MSYVFEKDTTSKTIYLPIKDSTTFLGKTALAFGTGGLIIGYTRSRAAFVQITLITQTVTGAYASGGFVKVDDTNAPGLYRLDLPNAALATGVDSLTVTWTGAGTQEGEVQVDLTDYDPNQVDKTGFSLSSAAILAIWEQAFSALTTAGTIGKKLTDGITGDIYARLGAPSGTIASDIASVQSDTNDIQARLPAALVSGKIPASLTAAGLDTDAVTEIVTAIFARTMPLLANGSVTYAQLVTAIASAFFNKSNGPARGTAGTVNIRNGADSANVLSQAVDTSGYHTAAPTINLSGA